MPPKKEWNSDLPDTSKWLPRDHAAITLQNAFFKRCQAIETKILVRAELEKRMNIDNFDSGSGVEDIIREELGEILPQRYTVRAGVIDDDKGRTAGDFEIIIANDFWFTSLKAGATNKSRRFHLPIEAVYAVIEVKQTLNYKSLDNAMEKLVTCHRLHRPQTDASQVIENASIAIKPEKPVVRNPLSSTIFATDLDSKLSMTDIIKRFFEVNKTLKREEIIHNICVLGHGSVMWAAMLPNGSSKLSLFMDDIDQPITPAYYSYQQMNSAFYPFAAILMLHLNRSILNPGSFITSYGIGGGFMMGEQVIQETLS